MRRLEGGSVASLSEILQRELSDRVPSLNLPKRTCLADLVASMLLTRSVNTSELASVLPRATQDPDSRFRYIHRFLSHNDLKPECVMKDWLAPLGPTLFPVGLTHILQLDQTQINETHEALVVSVWWQDRALPLLWKVLKTKGEIGFDHQGPLLRQLTDMLPKTSSFVLMADRFYGHSALIKLCQELGWGWRIRLKKNLIFEHEGGEMTPEDAHRLGLSALEAAWRLISP